MPWADIVAPRIPVAADCCEDNTSVVNGIGLVLVVVPSTPLEEDAMTVLSVTPLPAAAVAADGLPLAVLGFKGISSWQVAIPV